ncbi:2-phosphosulfolactate phosphatase [Myroides profundi]|uniref:Probable 2-phosphosulfolactate phosphatase n=1 Tax=Myroides profundi TaxID=480520 RepID=A0AAJ5BEK5_MYRPR|nr:2-phosphosulfolactate phosphatase [Myroides profundi]AJH14399.1 2-phosphosulfolactate phosphatase [Myroides profundi]SER18169.1 2-phosphosulfolactate phosphatase [Myroides profundi]
MIYNQHEYDIRMEWGLKGVEELAPISDVIIIVDVLSFSTCVDIATSRGAFIYPYQWKNETAIEYAKNVGAILADFKRKYTDGFSLSPTSLTHITPHQKLVLPSPNGATLSLTTGNTPTLCGCLRNAKAVANFAKKYGKKISIIAAGEQWQDNSLRVSLEDVIGAGAIISYLEDRLSPESKASLAIFKSSQETLLSDIKECSSGKELIARGFEKDVLLASDFNISNCVPVLRNGYFENGNI